MELRYNDLRYNDIPGITMNILCPGKSYSKIKYMGQNPDITIFDITISQYNDENQEEQT